MKFLKILEKRIELVPREEFEHRMEKARKISPDLDDAYFALALHRQARIWSDDRELQQEQAVEFLRTE